MRDEVDSNPPNASGIPPEEDDARTRGGRLTSWLSAWRQRGSRDVYIGLALLVALGLLLVIFSVESGGKEFLLSNLVDILDAAAILGVVTVGEVVVMIAGGLDISVGSTAGLVTAVVAVAMAHTHSSLAVGVLSGVLAGAAAGMLNGAVVAYGRVNSVIATLATYSAFLGIALLVTNGIQVGVVSPPLATLGTGTIAGVPYLVIMFVVVAAVAAWVMRYSLWGHSVYAVGGSSSASRLAGLRVQRFMFTTFVISGILAAAAGIMLVGQTGTALPSEGTVGLELTAITAVLLGGTGLSGGTGTVLGATLAVLVLSTLQNGLLLLGIPSFWQDVATGVLLLVAVLLQDYSGHKERLLAVWSRGRRRLGTTQ